VPEEEDIFHMGDHLYKLRTTMAPRLKSGELH